MLIIIKLDIDSDSCLYHNYYRCNYMSQYTYYICLLLYRHIMAAVLTSIDVLPSKNQALCELKQC